MPAATPKTLSSLRIARKAFPFHSLLAACSVALMAGTAPAVLAADLPGTGVAVQPIKSTIAEETFQTLLIMKGLQQLGYDVKDIKEIDIPAAYLAVANGDATFYPNHWDPLHADYYKNSGGDAKLWRDNAFSDNALQGYLIDKKTADKYRITNIAQLKDPELAKLFDTDGDGKADLTGCNPGWGCEGVIEHQLDAFRLRDEVTHEQGNYAALMGDTIARFKQGQPIFYYAWTPYWVSNVLVPGKDVVWLEVPFSSLPGDQKGVDTTLPNGKNYGFVVNTQRIMANRKFIEANPAAKTFFQEIKLPVGDINAENRAMHDGASKPADIKRHADGWIKAHQKEWDQWIAAAKAAAI